MKEFSTANIRNIVLASHSNSGKTMLVENILNFTGATTRIGKIEDGTTVSDFDDEEHRRGISLFTSVLPVVYKDLKLNLLDTPGYTDFVGEVVSAMRVADCALIMVDSVAGLEVGTEVALDNAVKFQIPQIMVINKMDRENANFRKALASVQEGTDMRLIPMQLPWGEKADFKGVIDLVSMKAYKGDGKTVVDIPDEFKAEAEEARTALIEAAAEGEDALLEKYFENGDLTPEETLKGLHKAIQVSNVIPVLVASGGHAIGIVPLLDALVSLAPAPTERPAVKGTTHKGEVELRPDDSGPLAAYVWKTTADPFVGRQTFFRVYSGVMSSDSRVWNANKGEEERLASVQVPFGKENQPVPVLHSGDIGTVAKLSVTTTGDTLTIPRRTDGLRRVTQLSDEVGQRGPARQRQRRPVQANANAGGHGRYRRGRCVGRVHASVAASTDGATPPSAGFTSSQGTCRAACSMSAGASSQPWRNRPLMRNRRALCSISGLLSGSAGRRLTSILTMRASASAGTTLCAAAISSTALRRLTGERSSLSISLAPTSTSRALRGTMYTRWRGCSKRTGRVRPWAGQSSQMTSPRTPRTRRGLTPSPLWGEGWGVGRGG